MPRDTERTRPAANAGGELEVAAEGAVPRGGRGGLSASLSVATASESASTIRTQPSEWRSVRQPISR